MTLTSLVFFTTYIVTQFANFRRGTAFCFVSCKAPLLSFIWSPCERFAWLTPLPLLSFVQTVAEVGGQTKTRLHFDCGSGSSSSTSSDIGARMTSRQGSSCKNKTKLKRQRLSQRKHSVFYPMDEESVHQRPAEESFFPAPFTNTTPNTTYPQAKVNPYLYMCYFLSSSFSNQN